jgi:hypothetical protein
MLRQVVHRLSELRNRRLAESALPGIRRSCFLLLLAGVLLTTLVVQPVAAQSSNPVCSDASGTLPNMIEGFIQLTTALGLMGLLVVWQADELAEMFTLGPEQKRQLKKHKRGSMKSAAVLVLLGPLFTIAGSVMDLPIASCVDLVPF